MAQRNDDWESPQQEDTEASQQELRERRHIWAPDEAPRRSRAHPGENSQV